MDFSKVLKKIISPLGIIIILLFFLYPLFISPFYQSHDGENHTARIASYVQSFKEGQLLPRWAGNLNYGYGSPVFIFFYPFPYYVGSLIHFFGFSFENSFKLAAGFAFIIAPIFFYFWMKILFRKKIAFIGAFLFALSPYHFLNLYVRGDLGELYALTFIPLVFYFLEKAVRDKKAAYILMGGIFYGLLVLSHNGISLMFSPVILAYGLYRGKIYRKYSVIILCIGLLLSLYFWFPALFEGKYVNAKLFVGDYYFKQFPSFWKLIYSSWGFGPAVNEQGGLSPQIGIVYVSLVIAGFILYIRDKKVRKNIIYWLAIFILAVIIVLPISNFIWNTVPLLKLYQFPWRFIALASFTSVVIGCYVINSIKYQKLLYFLLLFLFISSLPFLAIQKISQKGDAFYRNFPGSTYFHGEATPIWVAGDPSTFPKSSIEVIAGEATIKNLKKLTYVHSFTVESKSNVNILDNTLYFPGWNVTVDGRMVPIQFQDANHRGLITFQVPKGIHIVQVKFVESKVRLISDWISASAWIGVIGILAIMKLDKRKKKYR